MVLLFPESDPRAGGKVINKKRPWLKHGAKCTIVSPDVKIGKSMVAAHFHKCPYKKEYDLIPKVFLKNKSVIPKEVRVV
jgi:hypothetical protein